MSLRCFFTVSRFWAVVGLLAAFIAGPTGRAEETMLVYIGTYAGAEEPGIHCFQLNMDTGELTAVSATKGIAHPSFLALHPNGRYLYAVSEIDDFSGKKTGAVAALAIEPDNSLRLLNRQPSSGDGPCHLVVDKTGKCVLVANYGGGSVAAIPIADDGQLHAPSSAIQHAGSSVTSRQTSPHAHSINIDPQNRFAFAADLGLDQVLVYRLNAAEGKLTAHEPAFASVDPGSGPRHFASHPSGRFAYVINELSSTITAFAYDATKGRLDVVQTISTLPGDFSGTNYTAEVQVHPSGRFVYGSNRGHDSIAVFAVDDQTGQLTTVGQQASGGKTPRNFGIDPTGKFLLAANQDTGNVVVMRIDSQTGMPHPTDHQVPIPTPVCVKFRQSGR
jgi:6-phosphogluconolactonase